MPGEPVNHPCTCASFCLVFYSSSSGLGELAQRTEVSASLAEFLGLITETTGAGPSTARTEYAGSALGAPA